MKDFSIAARSSCILMGRFCTFKTRRDRVSKGTASCMKGVCVMSALLILLPVIFGGLATKMVDSLANLRRLVQHLSLNVLCGIAVPVCASLALPAYGQGQLLFDGSAKQCIFYFCLSFWAVLSSAGYLRISQVVGTARSMRSND